MPSIQPGFCKCEPGRGCRNAMATPEAIADSHSFLDRILPALPMLNKVRLEAACFAWQGGGTFPHTVLTGILVHSAVYIPALRHKCKELWAILLHLLDNEFRQPRLQTLQLALLDIYGRPFLNPGGNHTNICRVSELMVCLFHTWLMARRLVLPSCWACTATVQSGDCPAGSGRSGREYGVSCTSPTNGEGSLL